MDGWGRPRTAQAWSSWRPSSSWRRRLRRRCARRAGARATREPMARGGGRGGAGRARPAGADGAASGYRNGYRTGRMKTAEGMVEFAAPQVRDAPAPFVSAIRHNLAGRTGALEDLAVELYARGLSTRDIEDAFTDHTGRRLLSRAAVSEITERLLRK